MQLTADKTDVIYGEKIHPYRYGQQQWGDLTYVWYKAVKSSVRMMKR